MFNYGKNFFGLKRAEAFIIELKNNGVKDIELSSFRDAFDQTIYRVAWNLD